MSTKHTLTEKDVVSAFEEDGYDAYNNKKGVSDTLKAYLETHKMKTSTASTNAEKWSRIVRDCVPSEQYLANPSHYRSVPKKFMTRLDFLTYHYASGYKLLTSPPIQFILTALFLQQLHYWAYKAYVVPLRFFPFYNTMSCQSAQHITGCGVLHNLQQYSFKTGDDLKQYLVLVVSQHFVAWATKLMLPYKRA